MRKLLLLALTAIFTFSLFAVNVPVKAQRVSGSTIPVARDTREWTTVFEDDFEDETLEWTTSEDEPAPAESWHIDSDGFDGDCWWMKDPAINGYTDNRYLVMDSPAFVVPADADLTFKTMYKVEGIGGDNEYDGWDGFNVRIKVGDGEWTVLTNPTPDYSATSFYSFGNIWGEGPGIPAWGGEQATWQDISFDLAAYAGESVQIRFAFASDGAFCTDGEGAQGDDTMFGVKIDNIAVGTAFTANGDAASEMTATHFVNESYWELSAGEGFNNTQALKNPHGPNRNDMVVSPEMDIPAGGQALLTYKLKCDMPDYDGDADAEGILEDYVVVYAKATDATEWIRLHYLWANPDFLAPTTWQNVDQLWLESTLNSDVGSFCDLSDFAGQEIQLSFLARTDGNDDGGAGTGIFIDDVMVQYEGYQPAPVNLTAEADGNNVDLAWEAPVAYSPEELTYTSGTYSAVLGTVVPVAVRVDNDEDYAIKLSSVDFTMYTFNASATIEGSIDVKIWENAGDLPGQELGTVTGFTGMGQQTAYSANIEELNYMIPAGGSVFVGVDNYQDAGGDQGLLFETSTNTGHTFLNADGTGWTNAEVYQTGGDTPAAFTNSSIGVTVLVPADNAPVPDSYKVYRLGADDYEFVADNNSTTYTDTTPVSGAINKYKVTAMYGTSESPMSNEASAYVYPATATEHVVDDGTAESSYVPSFNERILTKFAMDREIDALFQVKFYLEEVQNSTLICVGYEADNDGMPVEDASFSISVLGSNLQQGWNIIDIPETYANAMNYNNGIFVGFKALNNASAFGVDEDNNGASYTGDGDEWEAYAHNFMIRAWTEVRDDVEDVNTVEALTLSNYPNPFNPVTTIKYNVPAQGNVELAIYNIKGQRVNTLVNDVQNAGTQTVQWQGTDSNGNSVSSGVYFYKVTTNNQSKTSKMVLMK